METLKTAVRFTVLTFVFIAGAISLSGMQPASRADTEAVVEQSPAEQTYNSPKKELVSADLGHTG